jgi:hypothetical protein
MIKLIEKGSGLIFEFDGLRSNFNFGFNIVGENVTIDHKGFSSPLTGDLADFVDSNGDPFADIDALELLLSEYANSSDGTDDVTVLNSIDAKLSNGIGTFGYVSGVSGTETLTGSKKVKSISAYSLAGGTVQINGGDSIIIPANGSVDIPCDYNLVDPTVIFTGTNTYLITYIS